jgi:hypothetical protein
MLGGNQGGDMHDHSDLAKQLDKEIREAAGHLTFWQEQVSLLDGQQDVRHRDAAANLVEQLEARIQHLQSAREVMRELDKA